MSEYCLTHGGEYIVYQRGNPIPYCQKCEDERRAMDPVVKKHE